MKPAAAVPAVLTTIALAVAAMPAQAQSNEDLLKELRSLRERVEQLERQLRAAPAAAAAPAPAPAPAPVAAAPAGMTPDQQREFSRIAVKTEALQDAIEEAGLKGLKISGQIDPTWIANRNQGDAGFVLLNGGQRYTYDNSYFGMLVLDFQKETENGMLWRLTLAPQRGAGSLFNGDSPVHEASVSIPLGDPKTRLWAGQIPDWSGYELSFPAGNKLITHNLLFDLTAPTAYTGAVLDHTMGKWWLRAGVANVNSARNAAGNRGQGFVYRVDYGRDEFSGIGFSGVHGKAANFAADGTWQRPTGMLDADGNAVFEEAPFASAGRQTALHLFEVDAYFNRGPWSLAGQVSVGQQAGAAIFNADGRLRDARWWGASATVGYALSPRLEAVLRTDYLANRRNGGGLLFYTADDSVNGIGRGLLDDGSYAKGEGVGANRWAVSLGLKYLYDDNATLKVEYRFDGADQPVFGVQRGGQTTGLRKSNHLLGAAVVVSF